MAKSELERIPETWHLFVNSQPEISKRTKHLIETFALGKRLGLNEVEEKIFAVDFGKRVVKQHFKERAERRHKARLLISSAFGVTSPVKSENEKLVEKFLLEELDLTEKHLEEAFASAIRTPTKAPEVKTLLKELDLAANMLSAIIFNSKEDIESKIIATIPNLKPRIQNARLELFGEAYAKKQESRS